MFQFFRKKITDNSVPNFLNLAGDIHSHILPGIDDGSPDIATSLQLIKAMKDIGIHKAVATPHIIGDMYRNTPETINAALAILNDACIKNNLNFEISAAAEYMLDDHFFSLLRRKEKLLTINKNYILTEFSYTSAPDNIEEMLFEILTEGYKPILAHPERYFYYYKNYKIFHKLREIGFLLQVNLLSLTGYYGIAAVKVAKYLFENELVDFVGTDMHHWRHAETLLKKENIILLNKFIGEKKYNDFEALV
ncbi:MAG: capsular biosynthesis protein [Chitinophagaceae bacterium]|nr:capsular biosynthesis protein [Chitinophagaceae bacterium]